MLHRIVDAWHVLTGRARAVRPQLIANADFETGGNWYVTGWDTGGNGLSVSR